MDWTRKPPLKIVRPGPEWQERRRQGFETDVVLAGANRAAHEARILAHQQRIERELAEREGQQERQPAVSTQERYQNRLALRSRHQDQLAQFLALVGGSATFAEIRQALSWTYTTLLTAAVGCRFKKSSGRVSLLG